MGIQRFELRCFSGSMAPKDYGDYVLFTDHKQVVAELTKLADGLSNALQDASLELVRLRAELAAKSKELRRIQIRATPHPDDNDDDRKRNLYHIESIAKAAMGEGNGR